MGGGTSRFEDVDWEKADGTLEPEAWERTVDGALPTKMYRMYELNKRSVSQREFDVVDEYQNLLYSTRGVPGTLAWFDVLGPKSCGGYLDLKLRVQVDLARRTWIIYRYHIPLYEGQKPATLAARKGLEEGIELYKTACITVSWSRYVAVVARYGPPSEKLVAAYHEAKSLRLAKRLLEQDLDEKEAADANPKGDNDISNTDDANGDTGADADASNAESPEPTQPTTPAPAEQQTAQGDEPAEPASKDESTPAEKDDSNGGSGDGDDNVETAQPDEQTSEKSAAADAPQPKQGQAQDGTNAGKIFQIAVASCSECVSDGYYDQHSSPESSLHNPSSFDEKIMGKISGSAPDGPDTASSKQQQPEGEATDTDKDDTSILVNQPSNDSNNLSVDNVDGDAEDNGNMKDAQNSSRSSLREYFGYPAKPQKSLSSFFTRSFSGSNADGNNNATTSTEGGGDATPAPPAASTPSSYTSLTSSYLTGSGGASKLRLRRNRISKEERRYRKLEQALEGVIDLGQDQPLIQCQEIYNRIIGNHQTSIVTKDQVVKMLQLDEAAHDGHDDDNEKDGNDGSKGGKSGKSSGNNDDDDEDTVDDDADDDDDTTVDIVPDNNDESDNPLIHAVHMEQRHNRSLMKKSGWLARLRMLEEPSTDDAPNGGGGDSSDKSGSRSRSSSYYKAFASRVTSQGTSGTDNGTTPSSSAWKMFGFGEPENATSTEVPSPQNEFEASLRDIVSARQQKQQQQQDQQEMNSEQKESTEGAGDTSTGSDGKKSKLLGYLGGMRKSFKQAVSPTSSSMRKSTSKKSDDGDQDGGGVDAAAPTDADNTDADVTGDANKVTSDEDMTVDTSATASTTMTATTTTISPAVTEAVTTTKDDDEEDDDDDDGKVDEAKVPTETTTTDGTPPVESDDLEDAVPQNDTTETSLLPEEEAAKSEKNVNEKESTAESAATTEAIDTSAANDDEEEAKKDDTATKDASDPNELQEQEEEKGETKEGETKEGEQNDDEDEEPQPLVAYWKWHNSLSVHKMHMHVAKNSDLALHVVLAILTNQVRYERNALAMTV